MNKDFEKWMQKVDDNINGFIGLSAYDLPDCCYRDMYDDGMLASEAAKVAIEDAGTYIYQF